MDFRLLTPDSSLGGFCVFPPGEKQEFTATHRQDRVKNDLSLLAMGAVCPW